MTTNLNGSQRKSPVRLDRSSIRKLEDWVELHKEELIEKAPTRYQIAGMAREAGIIGVNEAHVSTTLKVLEIKIRGKRKVGKSQGSRKYRLAVYALCKQMDIICKELQVPLLTEIQEIVHNPPKG